MATRHSPPLSLALRRRPTKLLVACAGVTTVVGESEEAELPPFLVSDPTEKVLLIIESISFTPLLFGPNTQELHLEMNYLKIEECESAHISRVFFYISFQHFFKQHAT